jgi:hypothetical protein
MVYSSQSLSRTEINTIYKMDQNNIPLDPHHIGIPSGVPKAISEPIVHSVQTVYQSCMQINTISKRPKWASMWLMSLGVPLGVPKKTSEPITCWAQNVHLSCVLINTISKWTKTSFHLTHVT